MSFLNAEKMEKNKGIVSSVLLALILWAWPFVGGLPTKLSWIMYLIILASVLWLVTLWAKDKACLKGALISPAVLWIVAFAAVEFIWGKFIFVSLATYSMSYHGMRLVNVALAYLILFSVKDKLLKVVTDMAIIECVVLTASIFLNDLISVHYIADYFKTGEVERLGTLPACGVIESGLLFAFTSIPLLYQLFGKREKKYIIPLAINLVMILLSGSKLAIGVFGIGILIIILGSAKDKSAFLKRILLLVTFIVVVFILSAIVPFLKEMVFDRIVEMFYSLKNPNADTSDNLRISFLKAAIPMIKESPIIGNGLYSFAYEEPTAYFKIAHSCHNNMFDILNFYGIIGFVAYYWFHVFVIVKSIKNQDKAGKLIALSIVFGAIFMAMGQGMFYKHVIEYIMLIMAYIFVSKKGTVNEK